MDHQSSTRHSSSAQVTPENFVEPSGTLAGYSSLLGIHSATGLAPPFPSSLLAPQRQGPISADMQIPHIQMTQ